jgi:hypothetical protein
VSWLLVALIPGLLMLATFGLQRLEAGLDCDTVSATDVAEFLQQAEASDVDTLARDGMGPALHRLHQRLNPHEPVRSDFSMATASTGLPTQRYVRPLHYRPNPEFQPTRHADRV